MSCARPAAPVPDDGIVRRLPGTDRAFTRNQAYFDYGPADWYPDDHPSMPSIVANGRQQDGVRACALCHYPNGKGKMENAQVAGLPEGYILQQLADFSSGVRRSADPRKANTNEMIAIARALTDAEARAAARYFASMPWTPWVRVIEADAAPKVRATTNGLFLPIEGGGTEPLGRRIIELPEHPERTDMMRDPRAGFVAYVPRGSIERGKTLVTTGGDRTTACDICHGDDLQGLGNVPGIAGRTASYTARQLYDFKAGTRSGVDAQLMKPVVARLTDEDMVAITAYLASRPPVTMAGRAARQVRGPAEGVYSAAQAARGRQLYASRCESCHGSSLEGDVGPPLAGESFLAAWRGRSLAELVDKIQKTMPPQDAGSVSQPQAIDLAAYLLQTGKFPDAPADLRADGLAQIVFPSGRTPTPAAADASSFAVAGNLAQVMRALTFPNANILFNVQVKDPATDKPSMPVPFDYVRWGATVYYGWQAVDQAALALIETAPLFLLPGRRCENGRPVPIDRPDFKQYTAELIDVGRAAYRASQSRDVDGLVKMAERLNAACANCHKVYRDGTREGDVAGGSRCR